MWGNKEGAAAKRAGQNNARSDKPPDPRRYANNLAAAQQTRAASHSFETASNEHLGDSKNKNGQGELAQKILVHHQSEPQSSSPDWMSRLKRESVDYLHEQRGLSGFDDDSIYKKGIELLMNKIFGVMQRYMYEFNKVASGTDLHVTGTISGDVTEVTRYSKLREVEETKTYFRARFSTRLYSLVLRGREQSIDVFLLPVNRTMALSTVESEYPPLATIEVRINEEGMMWRMTDDSLSIDSLDSLCMWLFSQLIDRTKGIDANDVE